MSKIPSFAGSFASLIHMLYLRRSVSGSLPSGGVTCTSSQLTASRDLGLDAETLYESKSKVLDDSFRSRAHEARNS